MGNGCSALFPGSWCQYIVAAEQKARVTYDNILRMSDDPDVNDAIKFLRAREVVHFQRFGEPFQTERNEFAIFIVLFSLNFPVDLDFFL